MLRLPLAVRIRLLAQGRAVSGVLLLLYQTLATVLFLAALPYGIFRALRHPREMWERLGWSGGTEGAIAWTAGPARSPEGPLWIHAASLGELEAVRALLGEPGRELEAPLLLTVLSVSARRRAQEAVSLPVAFAPLDLWFCLLPFLHRLRPRGLILTETELWPMTLLACRRRGIPVVLISARLSTRKWGRTRWLRFLLHPLLESMQGIAAQSALDAARFREMGGTRLEVLGNVKYRLPAVAAAGGSGERLREAVLERFRRPDPPARILHASRQGTGRASGTAAPLLLVAGSLRRGEECVLQAAGVPGVLLVIAPRHLRERSHWIEACRARGLQVAAWSEAHGGGPAEAEALLLDTHGELAAFYAIAGAAFVGGTLVAIGGHNLFEPAREGIPVAFGPYTGGVSEVAEPLLRRGGGFRVADGAELALWAAAMASDDERRKSAGAAAREAAREVAGAGLRTWAFLESFPWTRVRRSAGDAQTGAGVRGFGGRPRSGR